MGASFTKALIPVVAGLLLSACSGGGNLSLQPTPAKITVKGSPFVTVNQGGRSLIVEQGKTADTGVHGWVAINSVASRTLTTGTGGTAVIMNKPLNVNGGRGLSSQ